MLERVVILRPAGNDTALVFDDIHETKIKEVNDYVLSKTGTVEQVMFVDATQAPAYGKMAGGEFCGNATRSLGYCLLGGQDGQIIVKVSGAKSPLNVFVSKGCSKTTMPFLDSPDAVKEMRPGLFRVRLDGIEHLVLESGSQIHKYFDDFSSDEAKGMAKQLLDENDMLGLPASGVMVLSDGDNGPSIKPYVYVRSINTFFAETACGSGSLAVGLVEAKKKNTPIHQLSITQPSGMAISVDVEMANDSVSATYIDGPVSILYDGTL